ncbi:unnamed protein product, partial [Effrenium voratum]
SSSSCTGVFTSEMALSVIQKTVNDSKVFQHPVCYRPELRISMVEKLYGRHYSITCIYATTDDVGHSGTSRSRVYLVLVHKSMAKMTRDINQLYSKLAARLRSMVHTRPSDYMVAEPWEVQLEVAALAELRAKQNQRANFLKLPIHSLLSPREQEAIKYSEQLYRSRYGSSPCKDQDLVVHLGDDPRKFLCWSATSRRLPTRRLSSGRFWHMQSKRFMTSKEQLCSFGLPVTPQCALAMGVPILAVTDPKRAAHLAGNAMHFSTVSLILFLTLASCRMT